MIATQVQIGEGETDGHSARRSRVERPGADSGEPVKGFMDCEKVKGHRWERRQRLSGSLAVASMGGLKKMGDVRPDSSRARDIRPVPRGIGVTQRSIGSAELPGKTSGCPLMRKTREGRRGEVSQPLPEFHNSPSRIFSGS